jgi:hypothetical protein
MPEPEQGEAERDEAKNRRRAQEAAPHLILVRQGFLRPLPDFSLRGWERSLKMARADFRSVARMKLASLPTREPQAAFVGIHPIPSRIRL